MSGSGNCYDNAVMESFFHSLKVEHIFFEKYATRTEAKTSIFDYIETFSTGKGGTRNEIMTRRCFLNKIMSKRLEEMSIFSGSDHPEN